jgi:ribonuclease HI
MDNNKNNNFAINILQWNAQSLRPKINSLGALMMQEKIHIAIVSETWLDSETCMTLNSFNIFRKDRFDGYGGVVIMTHRSIQCRACPIVLNNAGIEIVCVQVLNCKNIEYILSVYCPSSVQTSASDWDEVFSKYTSKTIIAGDFNGHHANWSYKTDTRGGLIFDSAIYHGFSSLNNGEPTRLSLVNNVLRESSPDITFATSEIATLLDWCTTNENLGSDHLVILYSIKYTQSYNYIKKRNFKLANWTSYKNSTKLVFTSVNALYTIQEAYDFFYEQIINTADKTIPFKKFNRDPESKFKPKEYWNPSLSHIVAQRRLALKLFRKNPTPENLSKLQNKVIEARQLIRKAKIMSWHKFCTGVDEATSVSEMWRRMKWMKGCHQNRYYPCDDKLNNLLCSLSPDSVLQMKPNFESRNDLLESDFTMQELLHCLKRKDTSPGEDGITYSMIYNLAEEGKQFILKLYNDIFHSGHIPRQWRDIIIVPIPKPNANNNSEPKLRPISLISGLCKTFHTMISKRIEWYIEKHTILSRNATGFRRCHSGLDSLVRLITSIQLGYSKNIPTLACFLDVENAYNNISVYSVTKTLDELQVGATTCKYLWSFLSERHLKLTNLDGVGNLTRWTHKGLAQGDPISPLLFNVATYKISHLIRDAMIYQYADDFVLFVSHKDINTCTMNMQSALNAITKLLGKLGLELAPMKTKVCLFSRGRRIQHINLSINGCALTLSEVVRYLGMWLDRSLRWKKHINEIAEKTRKFLNILNILRGPTWGIHPKHLRTLYISLIRSRLDYGCFLYDNSAKTHLYKLEKIQNQAMRMMGGFIKSSPIHVMQSELGLPPLCIRRKYMAFKYCLKIRSWSNNITVELLMKLNSYFHDIYWRNKNKPLLPLVLNETATSNVASGYPLDMYSLNVWVTYINLVEIVQLDLTSVRGTKSSYEMNSIKFDIQTELYEKYKGWTKIYTDGSKSNAGLGAAYYNPSTGVRVCYKINSELSIMTLELVAIHEAMSYAIKARLKKFVIITDSKSALQHIARCSSGRRGVPTAYKILQGVHELNNNGIGFKLQWVPSHVGIVGNEEADRLAKVAITNGQTIVVKPFYSEVLKKYNDICYNKWKEYFDERSREKGIWYKIIQDHPLRIPWFYNSKCNRDFIVVMNRLRSGHYPCNKFAYLMKKVESPNCEVCHVLEDIHHLVMECAQYQEERRILVSRLRINTLDVGTIHSILSQPVSEEAYMLYRFVCLPRPSLDNNSIIAV